jgi:hypothetical protein
MLQQINMTTSNVLPFSNRLEEKNGIKPGQGDYADPEQGELAKDIEHDDPLVRLD